jgi:hypothetical protein
LLVDLLPAQAATLDAQLTATLAGIPNGKAKSDGIWVGRHAAVGILANRAGDGRFANVYQPTPPTFCQAEAYCANGDVMRRQGSCIRAVQHDLDLESGRQHVHR